LENVDCDDIECFSVVWPNNEIKLLELDTCKSWYTVQFMHVVYDHGCLNCEL